MSGRSIVHQARRVVGRGLRETSRASSALAGAVAPWAVAPPDGAPAAAPQGAPPSGPAAIDYGALWAPADERAARGLILLEEDDAAFDEAGRGDAGQLAPFIAADATVLDLGCGVGRVARHVAPRCARLWAVDASPVMLDLAARRLADLPNVRFARSSGTTMPDVPTASVDLVYSLLVLQHLEREDAFALLRDVHRVLVPGGRAVLTFPNLLSDVYLASFLDYVDTGQATNAARARFYTPQEVDRLLPAAGFDVDALVDASEIRVVVTARPG